MLRQGKMNPKDIIRNMSKAVSSKLAVGKLAVQIEVTMNWLRGEKSMKNFS